eukprot:scaffold77405_cov32-Tisochrysis_lutea.AAC.1
MRRSPAAEAKAASFSWDRTLRGWCLALIVVQNSSLILVTSYSRTLTPAYLPTVAVFLAECFKLIAAMGLLACEVKSPVVALSQVASLVCENGSSTLLFAVPALCYTLQNNLWYYALSHLDPVTAAVTSQMKIITTAVATVLMLGRKLTWLQWCALFTLTCGLVVIQMGDKQSSRLKETGTGASGLTAPKNSLSGAGAMMLATMLSAYSGVFLERLFKTVRLTLWLQSIQLSIFALPVAAMTMCVYDYRALLDGGLMVGFNEVVWVAVCLNAVGGIAVSMALKYADNILKTFAVGISIVLNALVSAVAFHVPLTLRVVAGIGLVIGATAFFNLSATGGAIDVWLQKMRPHGLWKDGVGDDSESGKLLERSSLYPTPTLSARGRVISKEELFADVEMQCAKLHGQSRQADSNGNDGGEPNPDNGRQCTNGTNAPPIDPSMCASDIPISPMRIAFREVEYTAKGATMPSPLSKPCGVAAGVANGTRRASWETCSQRSLRGGELLSPRSPRAESGDCFISPGVAAPETATSR